MRTRRRSVKIECNSKNSKSLIESRHCRLVQFPTPTQQSPLVEYPHLLAKNHRISVQTSLRSLHEHLTGIDMPAFTVRGKWRRTYNWAGFIDRVATN